MDIDISGAKVNFVHSKPDSGYVEIAPKSGDHIRIHVRGTNGNVEEDLGKLYLVGEMCNSLAYQMELALGESDA